MSGSRAYHMTVSCGVPEALIVPITAKRGCSRKARTSSEISTLRPALAECRFGGAYRFLDIGIRVGGGQEPRAAAGRTDPVVLEGVQEAPQLGAVGALLIG